MTSRHKITQQPSRKSVQTKRNRDSKTQPVSNQHNIQFANFPPRATIDNVSRSSVVQPKLKIGEVGDKYEQEADRVAKATVEQINAPEAQQVQRDLLPQPEEELQRKPLVGKRVLQAKPIPTIRPLQTPKISLQAKGVGGEVDRDLEDNINRAKSGGQSLAPDLQGKMGRAMGADFSNVKIHTDTHSDRLNQSLQAKAFTTGNHVFFKQGEYNPSSPSGQELIAHELTHVVQQNSNTVQRKTTKTQTIQCDFLKGLFGRTSNKEQDHTSRLTFLDKNFERALLYLSAYRLLENIAEKNYMTENLAFCRQYYLLSQGSPSENELNSLCDRYIQEDSRDGANVTGTQRQNIRSIRNDPNQTLTLKTFKDAYRLVLEMVIKQLVRNADNSEGLAASKNYDLLCQITNKIGYG